MYNAVLARAHTRPMEGADKLQLANVLGYQVVVGIDIKDGEMGAFFEQGGQLSEEFAQEYDLVRRKDENGNQAGGMFESSRRVKAIKLRGHRSDGFWMPLSGKLLGQLVNEQEGYQFDKIGNVEICRKYETQETIKARKSGRVTKSIATLPRYPDTEHLRRALHSIPIGARIYISEKLHGTSARYGHIKVARPVKNSWWRRLLRRPEKFTTRWEHISGTRNVVLVDDSSKRFYGTDSFRQQVVDGVVLYKGEILFGEIVGFTHDGAPIQPGHSLEKHSEAMKKFGKSFKFSYGNTGNQSALYVYHMAMLGEDGVLHNYTWEQVVGRCKELGLKVVPNAYVDVPLYLTENSHGDLGRVSREELLTECNAIVNGTDDAAASFIDSSHPIEGVVVRWEFEGRYGVLKHKSWLFGMLEGYLRDSDSYVDMEEVS